MEGNAIVSELLSPNNYKKWSVQVKTYLLRKELWDTVEADEPDSTTLGQTELNAWKKKNAGALHAIQISCGPEAFRVIEEMSSAKTAWTTLEKICVWKPDTTGNSNAHDPENQPLFKAVYRGDWETARIFLDQHPLAHVRASTGGLGKNALHIAVSEGHLHIVERLVERMTEQELEMERKDSLTALSAAIEIGNLSIAKFLLRKNKRLISITNKIYGLPVEHAVISNQKQMVPYLYSATPAEDLIFRNEGKLGASLVSQCIFAQQFGIALHLLEHAPMLAITSVIPKRSPVYALAHSKVFLSERSLTFWQRWIYRCIHVPDNVTDHISLDIQDTEYIQRDITDIKTNSSGIFLTYKKDKVRKQSAMLAKNNSISKKFIFTAALFGMLRWGWLYLLKLLDIKGLREAKVKHAQCLELLRRMCKVIESSSDEIQLMGAGVPDALIQAVFSGNVEFITSVARANPSLVWNPYVAKTVFEAAIALRQHTIFSLIYGLREKAAIVSFRDDDQNNMLHKAAAVAPPRLLNLIPGAALQMQRELQWFKEVYAIASPSDREWTNNQFLKPHALFTENHRNLVLAGEKWMKDTSSSSTVVGALIVTVTFAAAFTFPGGNHQDTGFPMFLGEKLFEIFMISNAVALFTSTTSVLMFLGILTSRYTEEDFLKSLPKKLIIGLSTLFLSIAAMIIAFVAGISLMFHQRLWIVVPSICLACIPVAFFVLMQFRLLVDIFMSTYGPSMFDRNLKRWI